MTTDEVKKKLCTVSKEPTWEDCVAIVAAFRSMEARLAELEEQRTYDLAGASHMAEIIKQQDARLAAAEELVSRLEREMPLMYMREIREFRAAGKGDV